MLRRRSLRVQLLLLQVAIVVGTVAVTGWVATAMQSSQIRTSYEDRMIAVAQSTANLETVKEAFRLAAPSEVLQPLAEVIRQSSQLTYVVITDTEGIRYSHPEPSRIGEKASSPPTAARSGEIFVGTQTGTLGETWRVKVPIFDTNDDVIGQVSVGILESTLRDDLLADLPELLRWLAIAALIGTLSAWAVSQLVWRRIYRLEPEQIAALLETREAMLHSIREGLVAFDKNQHIVLVNDEARRLLGLQGTPEGKHASECFEPTIMALLESESSEEQLVLSGERVMYAKHNSAVVDETTVGSILIVRDRTEVHEILEQLDGERDLTEALRTQAHEFSNRMHVVSGLLELGKPEEALDFIVRSGYGGNPSNLPGMQAITDPDLQGLLLAKITVAAERSIDIHVSAESEYDGEGTTDVLTIVGNLLDNAIEALGAHGRIDLSLERLDDGTTRIVVADDGAGIRPEDRDKVFESGWSTKATGAKIRGIGLPLIKRIAQRRGGDATVGPSSLGGARFEITLSPLPGGERAER